MNIILTRFRQNQGYIDGYLSNNNGRLCHTLENAGYCLPTGTYSITIQMCHQHSRKMPMLVVQKNDPSKSPEGDLQLGSNGSTINQKPSTPGIRLSTFKTRCEKCEKLEYVSNNTTMPCYCPQICPGNGAMIRKDGAIIIGDYRCSGCLIHPKTVFSRIYDLLRKTIERGNPVTLTIVENYHKTTNFISLTNFELGLQALKHFQ